MDLIYGTRVSNCLFTELKLAEYCSAFLAVIGLCLSMCLFEFKIQQIEGLPLVIVSICNLLCTFMLVISIYIRYDLWLSWGISLNTYTKHDTLINTRVWVYMVLEQLLCSICPYPFLEGIVFTETMTMFDTDIEYDINEILLFLSFIRIYLPMRFSFYLTDFLNPRT